MNFNDINTIAFSRGTKGDLAAVFNLSSTTKTIDGLTAVNNEIKSISAGSWTMADLEKKFIWSDSKLRDEYYLNSAGVIALSPVKGIKKVEMKIVTNPAPGATDLEAVLEYRDGSPKGTVTGFDKINKMLDYWYSNNLTTLPLNELSNRGVIALTPDAATKYEFTADGKHMQAKVARARKIQEITIKYDNANNVLYAEGTYEGDTTVVRMATGEDNINIIIDQMIAEGKGRDYAELRTRYINWQDGVLAGKYDIENNHIKPKTNNNNNNNNNNKPVEKMHVKLDTDNKTMIAEVEYTDGTTETIKKASEVNKKLQTMYSAAADTIFKLQSAGKIDFPNEIYNEYAVGSQTFVSKNGRKIKEGGKIAKVRDYFKQPAKQQTKGKKILITSAIILGLATFVGVEMWASSRDRNVFGDSISDGKDNRTHMEGVLAQTEEKDNYANAGLQFDDSNMTLKASETSYELLNPSNLKYADDIQFYRQSFGEVMSSGGIEQLAATAQDSNTMSVIYKMLDATVTNPNLGWQYAQEMYNYICHNASTLNGVPVSPFYELGNDDMDRAMAALAQYEADGYYNDDPNVHGDVQAQIAQYSIEEENNPEYQKHPMQ